MCGRYEYDPETGELERLHPIKENRGYNFEPNYNTAPTQTMPVLTAESGDLILQPMRWGIHRHIGPKIEKNIFNTRADKAFSPFWSKTVWSSRCLIPATGFYEWKITDGSKQPYFIHPKDRHLYMFAGIYSQDSDGNFSYSIMTTDPNKEMNEIHNRMPVILYPEDEMSWLITDVDEKIAQLLSPLEDGALELYAISTEVNSVKNNYPELSDKIPA
jgi:putative SOS response-associated peptidase YedK